MTAYRSTKSGDILVPHRYQDGTYKGSIRKVGDGPEWKRESDGNVVLFHSDEQAHRFLTMCRGAFLRLRNSRTGQVNLFSSKNLDI